MRAFLRHREARCAVQGASHFTWVWHLPKPSRTRPRVNDFLHAGIAHRSIDQELHSSDVSAPMDLEGLRVCGDKRCIAHDDRCLQPGAAPDSPEAASTVLLIDTRENRGGT